MIFDRFFPDMYVRSVYELPIDELKKRSIKVLVFDIDNTLAPFDVAKPDDDIVELLKFLKKQGFKLSILSNNNKKRIEIFNENLGTLAVYKAGKPGIKKLRAVMKRFDALPEETAMIGDHAFTHVWCGIRAGALSILTSPICKRDQLITKVKRGMERFVMGFYFRREGIKPFKIN